MEKGKKLEWLMAVILLSAAYVLSREGARLVAAQKAATKVVVLDSGHGGDDPGKIGANGVKEKDINLAIARLLKKKLEKQGILVVMTREGEDDLSDPGAVNAKVQDLQRRVQLIHKKKPDCVISIHQNSYPDAAVKGAQVFYYTDSKEGEKLALCMQAALVAGAAYSGCAKGSSYAISALCLLLPESDISFKSGNSPSAACTPGPFPDCGTSVSGLGSGGRKVPSSF